MKTILAFLLLCSQAFATSLCVRVAEPNGVRAYGTAVVLDKRKGDFWIAVTAKHVLQGATAETTSVSVDGEWSPVHAIYKLQGGDDVVFFTFEHAKKFKVPLVAAEDAGRGQMVKWTGYSGGKKFERFSATVQNVGDVAMARGEMRPRQGQSGGGVYDERNQLCGVVSGYVTNTGELIYTPICHIQRRCHRQWGFGIGIGIGGGHVVPNPAPVYVPRPAKPPAEVEPDVAPPPPTDDPSPTPAEKPAEKPTADLQRQLDELRELILSIPGCKCINKDGSKPSASIGPPCRCGDACKGKCGNGCNCDPSAVTAEIEKAKVPIRVQILKPDGSIYDEETFPHGTPLKLKLSPVKK